MKIYIVRHGETEANKKGLLQGWSNTNLSQFGIELAELTAEGLKNIKFDAVFSSPLQRAYDTAKIILNKNIKSNCNIQIDERLKEINMGFFEEKSFKGDDPEIDLKDVETFFKNPFLLGKVGGGESALEVCKRTQNFLKDLVKNNDYETVLIATHGFAVRAMLNFLYPNSNDFWQGHVPYNCSVNILEYKNSKFKILENDKIYYENNKCIDRYKMK